MLFKAENPGATNRIWFYSGLQPFFLTTRFGFHPLMYHP
jgi:hypothetical protein